MHLEYCLDSREGVMQVKCLFLAVLLHLKLLFVNVGFHYLKELQSATINMYMFVTF